VKDLTEIDVPKIIVTPPGPNAKRIVEEDEKFLMQSFVRWYPLVLKEAKGCILTDVDGNKYIDLNAGIAVTSVGSLSSKGCGGN
jgi:4-aminobutyrate aminotransferase